MGVLFALGDIVGDTVRELLRDEIGVGRVQRGRRAGRDVAGEGPTIGERLAEGARTRLLPGHPVYPPGVDLDLGRDHIREYPRAVRDHCRRGLVARRLDSKNKKTAGHRTASPMGYAYTAAAVTA